MEQKNYQEEYKKLFSEYLANPDSKDVIELESIEILLDKFPFCQSLHFMYAAGLKNDPEKFNTRLTKVAAVAPQREILHQTIYHPEKLVLNDHLVSELKNGIGTKEEIPEEIDSETVTEKAAYIPEIDIIAEEESDLDIGIADNELLPEIEDRLESESPEAIDQETNSIETNSLEVENSDANVPEAESLESEIPESEIPEAVDKEINSIETNSLEVESPEVENTDADELEVESHESTGNGTNGKVIESAELESPRFGDEETDPLETETPGVESKDTEDQGVDNEDIEEDEILIPDNIARADYFTFDQSVADPLKQSGGSGSPEEGIKNPADKVDLKNSGNADTKEVAKYNDDTLPYTFLWWLNKTRKEHTDTYQPYVNFKLDTTRPIRKSANSELNQQIIENIFHLQPALTDQERKASSNTVEFQLKRKEEDIIEKFIKEDPQIRPMPPEKISSENKARKSAEYRYDMVSETLARIYTDQMLFHKAIDTYKKLSLKFPEKNAYFADQISELEKKIN